MLYNEVLLSEQYKPKSQSRECTFVHKICKTRSNFESKFLIPLSVNSSRSEAINRSKTNYFSWKKRIGNSKRGEWFNHNRPWAEAGTGTLLDNDFVPLNPCGSSN